MSSGGHRQHLARVAGDAVSTSGTWIASSAMARGTLLRGRSAWRRSISTTRAGNTVIITSHESRMAVPEMNPSSCTPRKSVRHST